MVVYCCYPGCWKSGSRFFRFPVNKERRKIWLGVLNSNKTTEQVNNLRICEKHFDPIFVIPAPYPGASNRGLRPNATPLPPQNNINTFHITSQINITHAKPETPTHTNKAIKRKPETSHQGIKKKMCLRKASQLTAKEQILYTEMQHYHRKLVLKTKQVKQLKARVHNITNKHQITYLKKITGNINNVTRDFLFSLITLVNKKAKGRRFSTQDKIINLALYKQSPRGYKVLKYVLPLSSIKSLKYCLNRVPLEVGINSAIFDNLRERAKLFDDDRDKICALIFDEMSVKANTTYMCKNDMIHGFENFGTEQRAMFADQAVVFMLRGLRTKWTQAIAFMFRANTAGTPHLVRCIKEVLHAVYSTGLKVVATICDQGSTNTAAISELKAESRAQCLREGKKFRSVGYFFKDWEIIHLYDPPHLIKGIRNNLLTKNLTFTLDTETHTAQWKHIELFYNYDKHRIRRCPKLTDSHICADKIPKLAVKHAAQIFSYTLYTNLFNLVDEVLIEKHSLDKSAIGTAKLCGFFDKLFDSVNSRNLRSTSFKPLDCALSTSSPHLEFWSEARQILNTMKFIDANGKPSGRTKSIINWIETLNGFEALWKILKDLGFQFLILRNLNQDPLENFFGRIKAHEGCNSRPTCSFFASSFKSLVVSSLMTPHSKSFNCEDDGSETLGILRHFVDETVVISPPVAPHSHTFLDNPVYLTTHTRPTDTPAVKYVFGYITKKMLQLAQSCKHCSHLLTTLKSNIPSHSLTSPRLLSRPTTNMTLAFNMVSNIIWNILPDICHIRGIGGIIVDYIKKYLDVSFLNCSIHNLSNTFIKLCVKFLIFTWCKRVNKFLAGQDMKIRPDMDHVQKSAAKRFLAYRHKK